LSFQFIGYSNESISEDISSTLNWDSSSDQAILASSFDIVEDFNSTTSIERKQDSISEAETEITTISPIDGSSEAPDVGKSATGEGF
jgi:hypothetical protein